MRGLIAQEGNLARVDFGGPGAPVTKKQLARILGKTERWVEYRLAEGMPSALDDEGRRIFSVSEVRMWFRKRERGVG